jgi:hypothetical protein
MVALLLQLLIAAGLPVVEGSFEHPLADDRAHLEADNGTGCTLPIHNELNCQFCRGLNREQLGSAGVALVMGGSWVFCRFVPSATAWYPSARLAAAVGARAPPLI